MAIGNDKVIIRKSPDGDLRAWGTVLYQMSESTTTLYKQSYSLTLQHTAPFEESGVLYFKNKYFQKFDKKMLPQSLFWCILRFTLKLQRELLTRIINNKTR